MVYSQVVGTTKRNPIFIADNIKIAHNATDNVLLHRFNNNRRCAAHVL